MDEAERKQFFETLLARMLHTMVKVSATGYKPVQLTAIVDTGAPISVISAATAKALGFHPPKKRRAVLMTPGGNVRVYGVVWVDLQAEDGPKVSVLAAVSSPEFLNEARTGMILGLDYLAPAIAHVDIFRRKITYKTLPVFTSKARNGSLTRTKGLES